MNKTTTNLILALGVITIAFAGYYFYTQQSSGISFTQNDQTLQNMLNNTQVFIERRQTLDQVELDIGFFEDERFQSYRSYTTPIEERPVGRADPFSDAQTGEGVSF